MRFPVIGLGVVLSIFGGMALIFWWDVLAIAMRIYFEPL